MFTGLVRGWCADIEDTETEEGPALCIDGYAAGFPCNNINLLKNVSLQTLGATSGNDIWGWTDTTSGSEYVLMGLNTGTAFIRIDDPENPVLVGTLPTQTINSGWRDMKVYEDTAYIVADVAAEHGMQVFDLTRLRTTDTNITFTADGIYAEFGRAHNVVINESSGFAYIVGTDTCDGGLHIIDIQQPLNPVFSGCHSADGDTHDAQCVNYTGPDPDHNGAEICFNSNEESIAIVDVSIKSSPVTLSVNTYPGLGFSHQAWLDESQQYLLVNDEFDEILTSTPTRTIVMDVSDLDNPVYLYAHLHSTTAVDHNLYVLGNRLYEANYRAGLRILEFSDLSTDTLAEVAYFDTYPANDNASFDGAWSVYPYFSSGTIVVSDINRGLFILQPN